MILDALTLLSDAQAFSTDAYTTNTIDLLAAGKGIGTGEPMGLFISVDVAATGGGVYEFHLCQSANANLSSDDELITRVIAEADLTAGSLHIIPIPAGAITKRYIGGKFDNVSGSTAVTCTIWVAPLSFIDKRSYVTSGFTVS